MLRHAYIRIHQLYYSLPNNKPVFSDLSLAFSHHKIGLVGKNGIGKSTLLKLIVNEITSQSGAIHTDTTIAYIPQNPVIPAHLTVAGFLGVEQQIQALHRIMQGSIDERDFTLINEEWNIEESLQQQLSLFGLESIPYHRFLHTLSGGEMTRLFLTKLFYSDANFLLLDEPTNHLDILARKQLYQAIAQWNRGMIVASHDRTLLNLMEEIVELNTLGVAHYGGNYDFYIEQKTLEKASSELALHDAKKLLHKTNHTIQASREKHAQKQSYGRQLRKSGSIDKLSANSAEGRSERTQSKLLIKEKRLLEQAEKSLTSAREKIEISHEINVTLPNTTVPNGKTIVAMDNITFSFSGSANPIINNFTLKIQGPERIALAGSNGSGKTTLVKLLLGELTPQHGTLYLGTEHVSYVDQHAHLLNPELSVLQNFLNLNPETTEQYAYQCLAQFLFRNIAAKKLVSALSGGEKLRAILACVLLSQHPPQLLILDEPTNHLDLSSLASIESALIHYQGAMIVISHDQKFLENIGIESMIYAPFTL